MDKFKNRKILRLIDIIITAYFALDRDRFKL